MRITETFNQNLLLLSTFAKLVNSPFLRRKVKVSLAMAVWKFWLYLMAPWFAF